MLDEINEIYNMALAMDEAGWFTWRYCHKHNRPECELTVPHRGDSLIQYLGGGICKDA